MAGACDDLHARSSRYFRKQTNIAADVGGRHINDRLHTLISRCLQFVDHFGDETRPPPEKLRPNLHNARGTCADMFMGKRKTELGGIERSVYGLNDTGNAPSRCCVRSKTGTDRSSQYEARCAGLQKEFASSRHIFFYRVYLTATIRTLGNPP